VLTILKKLQAALYYNEYFWNYWGHDTISTLYIEGMIFNTKEKINILILINT